MKRLMVGVLVLALAVPGWGAEPQGVSQNKALGCFSVPALAGTGAFLAGFFGLGVGTLIFTVGCIMFAPESKGSEKK